MIERLARTLKDVWLADADEALDWTAMARAALVELAKVDVDDILPDEDAFAETWWENDGKSTGKWLKDAVVAHVAPVIAAQRARIAELEKIIAGHVEPKASIHQPLRCYWQHESEPSDWFLNHTPQEAAQEFADEDEEKTVADTILVEDESGKIVARFAARLEWELKPLP